MKIALCFSGQPRNVADGYHQIFKPYIIDANQKAIDVFVHLWFNHDDIGKTYTGPTGNVTCKPIPPDVLHSVYELYNPKKMLIEHQIQFANTDRYTNKAMFINPFMSYSKMTSTQRTNELRLGYEKENGFTYDVVLSCRFDVGPTAPLILNQDFNDGVIYHFSGCGHGHSVNTPFVWGSSNVITKFSNTIDMVDQYYNQGISFTDEILVGHHMTINNVDIFKGLIPHPYTFIRG